MADFLLCLVSTVTIFSSRILLWLQKSTMFLNLRSYTLPSMRSLPHPLHHPPSESTAYHLFLLPSLVVPYGSGTALPVPHGEPPPLPPISSSLPHSSLRFWHCTPCSPWRASSLLPSHAHPLWPEPLCPVPSVPARHTRGTWHTIKSGEMYQLQRGHGMLSFMRRYVCWFWYIPEASLDPLSLMCAVYTGSWGWSEAPNFRYIPCA